MVIGRNRKIGSGSGSSTVGAINYDKQSIKNAFLSRASARKLDSRYKDGDGGYFSGGRCNWGAGHSFDEDVQRLVGTFNKVSEMSETIQSLQECNSSEEFLAQKNALTTKCQQAIDEMGLQSIESKVGYSVGLCIIWEDYTATFLTPYLNSFTSDLNKQLEEINSLDYQALVQLESLKIEEQKIKGEIQDTYRQAEEAERNGDKDKAAELYQVVKNLRSKHEQIVSQITNNPWNKASQYDYTKGIEQILSVLGGKTDPENNPPVPNQTPSPNGPNQSTPPGSSGRSNPTGNQIPRIPWGESQGNTTNQGTNQQQLIFIAAVAAILIVFFFMNSKEEKIPLKPNFYDYDF